MTDPVRLAALDAASGVPPPAEEDVARLIALADKIVRGARRTAGSLGCWRAAPPAGKPAWALAVAAMPTRGRSR